MPFLQLIYVSRPFGFDDLTLSGILASARINNALDQITGALICREDLFMQLLEGPLDAVRGAYERIQRDDRHTDVTLKIQLETADRLFPDWAMRHDPARSWMWTREQVTAGAVDQATPDDVRQIFVRLAHEPVGVGASGCPMSTL